MRLLLLLLLLSLDVYAVESLKGQGHANCSKFDSLQSCTSSAQVAAISMLSSQIFSFIETRNTLSRTKINGELESLFQSKVRLETAVPVIGADINCEPKTANNVVICTATLNKESAKKTYYTNYKDLLESINTSYIAYLEGNKKNIELLDSITNKFSELEMLSAVLSVLGIENLDKPLVSFSAISEAHSKHIVSGLSPLAAAKTLATSLPNGSYIINVPTRINGETHEPEGLTFENALRTMLTTAPNEATADFIVSSMVDDSGEMIVTTKKSKSGKIVQTKLLKLTLAKDKKVDDPILKQSIFTERIPKTEMFQTRLRTNKGERGMIFNQGERVVIEAMLSGAGCFYIAVKSKSQTSNFNYLLQLKDGPLNLDSAVQCISGSQVGDWFNIGTFDVAPPFGTEELSLFASPNRASLMVPQNVKDDGSGYLVLQNEPIEITRGLKRVIAETSSKTIVSQSVIQLVTVP